MAEAADINTYGGVFSDEKPVENPKTQQAAAFFNRMSEDTAQMTRTSCKARITFVPVATAGPIALDASTIGINSHWGSGSTQKPAILKNDTGDYTITMPASFTDTVGYIESVAFLDADAGVRGTTLGRAQVYAVASNVISVHVYNSSNALADLTTATIVVRAE